MAKTDTRVARSITFTVDTLEEKAAMQAHAKRRGLTLAGLLKLLLAEDMAQHPAPTTTPGAAG